MTALNSEGLEKARDAFYGGPGKNFANPPVGALEAAITAYISALPPVDGLEVVAEIEGLLDAYWGLAFMEGREGHDTDTPEDAAQKTRSAISSRLVTLSQASTVIAGLTAERDEWKRQEQEKTEIAAERISSLEEENKRLIGALSRAERSFNNIRGAIESNQVVDKDAHGTAVRARDAARQALEQTNDR